MYKTPEQAAKADLPKHLARVIDSEICDDLAVVIVEENDAPSLHYSLGVFRKTIQGWAEVASAGSFERGDDELWVSKGDLGEDVNGGGPGNLGIGIYYGQAPDSAEKVRVSWAAKISELEVRDGYFLLVDWSVDERDWARPSVVAYKRGEGWIRFRAE